jgi:translation initiation factor IF-3
VEISPNAKPPVCKIMDYGKYKYKAAKKQQSAKKKQNIVQIKEIKVRLKTGEHDLNTKMGHIRKFIAKTNKVKVTLMFRGREIALKDMSMELFKKIAADLEDITIVEQGPRTEGRTMMMLLAPK